MLIVRGKGGRERMVPLNQPARTAVAAWLPVRDGWLGGRKNAYLFPAAPGRRSPDPRQRSPSN